MLRAMHIRASAFMFALPFGLVALGLAAPAVAAPSGATTEPFAPVPIAADVSSLPATEQQALAKLIRAAQLMDPLFLRQAWAGNEPLLLQLLHDATPAGRARLRQFLVNKGPWDPARPQQALRPRGRRPSRRRPTSTRPTPPRRRSRRG